MTPRSSSRLTRWWTAEVDSPVALPRSVYDMRPSTLQQPDDLPVEVLHERKVSTSSTELRGVSKP